MIDICPRSTWVSFAWYKVHYLSLALLGYCLSLMIDICPGSTWVSFAWYHVHYLSLALLGYCLSLICFVGSLPIIYYIYRSLLDTFTYFLYLSPTPMYHLHLYVSPTPISYIYYLHLVSFAWYAHFRVVQVLRGATHTLSTPWERSRRLLRRIDGDVYHFGDVGLEM